MRIVIVGCGKVGSTLAMRLQEEGHELTIIDRSERVIEQIGNVVDVIGYVGNGAVYSVLESADVRNADLLLAVTATDEINLLTCLVANKLGVKHTIARVRNPEYAENATLFHEEFGVSMTINPERQLANEIARILRFPSATRVEMFARGRAEMVSCTLPEGAAPAGLKLYELPQKLGLKVLVCAVRRNDEVLIPSGGFELCAGDELYMTGAPKEVEKAFRKMGMWSNPIKNVLIAGGGKVSYYLAQALADRNFRLKIIERDPERAAELAESLPNAVVLLGDSSDHELLTEEGLAAADAFVALTGLDEGNILSALYAKRIGVNKIICKVNNDHLKSLTENAGLESTVSSKNVTANTIVRVVRAYAAGEGEGNVRAMYRLADGRAEILEFAATADMIRLIGIPLKDLKPKMKKDILVACIVRKNKAIVPGGADVIEPNDRVLIVTADQRLTELTGILVG